MLMTVLENEAFRFPNTATGLLCHGPTAEDY